MGAAFTHSSQQDPRSPLSGDLDCPCSLSSYGAVLNAWLETDGPHCTALSALCSSQGLGEVAFPSGKTGMRTYYSESALTSKGV